MKKSLLILLLVLAAGCTKHSENNISTYAALEKFNDELKDQTFLVFPQSLEKPIQWFDSIPEAKIREAGLERTFSVTAQPGEYFVYQLGVWAIKSDVEDIQVEFSELKNGNLIIPANAMTCFNTGGIDFKGKRFNKEVDVKAGRVQALWMDIDLDTIETGTYTGSVSVVAEGEKHTVPLRLKVSGEPAANHGYNQGRGLSRLNWLNSTVGIDQEVTKGYTPVSVSGKSISILGRRLNIAENGLPASITSFFDGSNQAFMDKGTAVVQTPFRFIIEKEDGETIRLQPGSLEFTGQTPSKVAWSVVNTSDECTLECMGQMEFDGFVDYKLKLTAGAPLKVRDIRLEIPVVKEKAEYMMGLGHEGGLRKLNWQWHWDVSKNQDMLWVGAVNGGLRVKWKAENYLRPLVNIYYAFGPLNLPPSWGNAGKGGVDVTEKKREVLVNAYSGSRQLKKGDVLNYDFELLITPLKLIDRNIKFGDRYYHGGGTNAASKIKKAQEAGANIINIHHAEDIYPFINYPYLDENVEELTLLVSKAHEENLRMKFYYTTRELTKNLPEFWAFNSLNGEVIFPGPGNASRTEALHPDGPNEWLIKNLREKYIPAWYNEIKEGPFKGETDLSVITTPDSRLNNFYIAGLDWMVQNMDIDGVYIDDSALDRFTLRRARKIIDGSRPKGRMDLHSWNHYNGWAGFANSLNLYMDLLPYFDLVWIGEGRDYDRFPDHWLIEVSGIPFGLSGQMLQGGGNPWRGMVYGITNRAGWTKWPPDHLWKFFDEYKIAEKEMIGYWQNDCPITCNNPLIRATVYKGADEVIISVANWGENDEETFFNINWPGLGLNSPETDIYIPEIVEFQEEKNDVSLDEIVVSGKKGCLIILQKKK